MPTLLTIALRNVLRNRRRTLMTLAALFVGVSVLISIRGFLNGLQRALVVNVTEGQLGALQVHKKGYLTNVLSSPLNLNMPQDIADKVLHVAGVKAVAPRIMFAGMVSNGDDTLFTAITAVEPKSELVVCPLRLKTLTAGSQFAGVGGDDGVVLTVELARSIGLKPGDEAALLAPDIDGSLAGENIHLRGTMRLQLPGEKKIAVAPLALAQKLLKLEGRITELAVSVNQLDEADAVAGRVREAVGPDYEVQLWHELALFVRQAMTRQNFLVSIIAVAFMTLMLMGVANTMLMSMLERTREIGTMMAVGVRRGTILVMFVLEAVVVGALGGISGSIVGTSVVLFFGARGVEVKAPGSHVPFTLVPYVTPAYVALVIVIATVGAGVFSLYPAWRASRLRPVQALAGN